jgi:membrane protein
MKLPLFLTRLTQSAEPVIEHAKEGAEPIIERGRRHWIGKLVANYLEDDVDGLAARLAYAAMFSLMPILTVTFLVITTLLEVQRINNAILEHIASDIPPGVESSISGLVNTGENDRTILAIMTFVTFILGGNRLYSGMDRGCAKVFRTPRRTMVKRKLFTLLMMTLIPVLLLAATVVAVIATALVTLPVEKLFDIEPSHEQTFLLYLSSFLLAFLLMVLAYWRIPAESPGLRYASEAAALTALLVVLLAQFFPLYIRITGGYSVYGSLFAFVLLLLLWLYFIGQIFVIGAEIAAFRSGHRNRPDPPEER